MSLIGKTVTFIKNGNELYTGLIIDKVVHYNIVQADLPSGEGRLITGLLPVSVDKYLVKTNSKVHLIDPLEITKIESTILP
jgi:hypothetical protein